MRTRGCDKRLLWIDDEAEPQEALLCLLAQQGFDIRIASNGSAGINLASCERFDCIVVDLLLPDMFGLTVIERIRQFGMNTPVLAVTAHYLESEVARDVLLRGGSSLIYKPILDAEKFSRALLDTFSAPGLVAISPTCAENAWSGESIPPRLRTVRAILEQGAQPDSITEIAARVNWSASRLRHAWHQATNTSLVTYRKHWRLDQAARLLRQTVGSVSQIAYGIGFNDLRYFEKEFRRKFGCAPRQYRAEANIDGYGPLAGGTTRATAGDRERVSRSAVLKQRGTLRS